MQIIRKTKYPILLASLAQKWMHSPHLRCWVTGWYRSRIRYRSSTSALTAGQANLDVRHDDDWSNGTTGERRRVGSYIKRCTMRIERQFDRGISVVHSTTSRHHPRSHHPQTRGYRRCQRGSFGQVWNRSRRTSNVSRAFVRFYT